MVFLFKNPMMRSQQAKKKQKMDIQASPDLDDDVQWYVIFITYGGDRE